MKKTLGDIGIDDDMKKNKTQTFFEAEHEGVRKMGFVDCQDATSFDEKFTELKPTLPSKFIEWLETGQGWA